MNIWKLPLSLVKTKRFYVWCLVFVLTGFILRAIPQEAQKTICGGYQSWIEKPLCEQIDQFFGTLPPEAPTEDPILTSAASISNSAQLKEMLRNYFCPKHQVTASIQWAQLFNVNLIMEILAGSIVFAAIATIVIPTFGNKTEQAAPQPALVVAVPENLFRNNSRLYVGLAYAFLSCVACILVPPVFTCPEDFSMRDQVPHLIALMLAAGFAGAWGTWKLYKSSAAGSKIAVHIALAGVFASSLIALFIAMPYRVMTSIEGAGLSFAQVKIFTIIRLVLLPCFAALVALCVITVVRFWKGRAMHVFGDLPAPG